LPTDLVQVVALLAAVPATELTVQQCWYTIARYGGYLHRRSGGDLPTVLDHVATTLGERRAAAYEHNPRDRCSRSDRSAYTAEKCTGCCSFHRDVDCDDLSGPGRRAGHDDTEAGPRFNRCPCRFWNDGVRLDFGEQVRIDLATVRGPQKLREILGCLIR